MDEKPKKAGRPAFKPTKAQREDVEIGVWLGLTVDQIAGGIGVVKQTVYKYFAEELAHGKTKLRTEIRRRLLKVAREDNVTALKHLDANPAGIDAKGEPLGKKEAQVQESHTAHEGTGWDSAVKSLNS
jgi:hypothetical protein